MWYDTWKHSFSSDLALPSHWLASPDTWTPKTNLRSDEKQVTLLVEVPGVKAADLEVTLTGPDLVVQGSRQERKFKLRFEVCPDTLDTDKMTASLEDGILTVTVPRMQKAQPRKISVTEPKMLS